MSETGLGRNSALLKGALVYSEEQEQAAKAFAAEHAAGLKHAVKAIVAVTSASGHGHSWLAPLIARELTRSQGVLAKPLAAASFYRPGTSEIDWRRFAGACSTPTNLCFFSDRAK